MLTPSTPTSVQDNCGDSLETPEIEWEDVTGCTWNKGLYIMVDLPWSCVSFVCKYPGSGLPFGQKETAQVLFRRGDTQNSRLPLLCPLTVVAGT